MRILIWKIVADVNEDKRQIVLLIHWTGGRNFDQMSIDAVKGGAACLNRTIKMRSP